MMHASEYNTAGMRRAPLARRARRVSGPRRFDAARTRVFPLPFCTGIFKYVLLFFLLPSTPPPEVCQLFLSPQRISLTFVPPSSLSPTIPNRPALPPAAASAPPPPCTLLPFSVSRPTDPSSSPRKYNFGGIFSSPPFSLGTSSRCCFSFFQHLSPLLMC